MTSLSLLAGLAAIMCQSRTSFEVASIKPHPEPITVSTDPTAKGTFVTATASTLADLIASAYNVKYDQIAGAPAWANASHYDLNARASGDAAIGKPELQAMLQSLLAERFHLTIHRETRVVPAFDLVTDKGGPKLRETSASEPGRGFVRGGTGGMHMEQVKGTMDALAKQLSISAERPVENKTGLSGYYAFKLDWVRGEPTADLPDIFTAVKQLGLRLQPSKAQVEMLVIDRAEKPLEN